MNADIITNKGHEFTEEYRDVKRWYNILYDEKFEIKNVKYYVCKKCHKAFADDSIISINEPTCEEIIMDRVLK